MTNEIISRRQNMVSLIKGKLSEYGLDLAECGSKNKELTQPISSVTGYWAESSFNSKPTRLIIHFDVSDDSIVASLPEANHNRTFAYANTGEHRKVGGLVVRTIPVFVTTTGRDNTVSYHPFPEWEWALWFVFAPKLRSGTSGEVFNHLNPLDGSFQYKGESQKYVAAGLVSLLPENEVFLFPDGVQQITYGQATNALASLIQVETSIRDAARVANGQEARLNA